MAGNSLSTLRSSPASMSTTFASPSSESRLAMTHPPEPPPTMMKSACSGIGDIRESPSHLLQRRRGDACSPRACRKSASLDSGSNILRPEAHGLDIFLVEMAYLQLVIFGEDDAARSDEHTSELHSLL